MSALFDSLSEELFQVLKGYGMTLTLYGSDGNKVYEPKQARRVFATPDNIMVSVVEAGSDSEVKLYLSQSTDVANLSKLINTLRQISTRYNVLLNVRKFSKEIQPKDFAYQSVSEASMWGSTKTSYQRVGSNKLIVRHTMPVKEGIIGSRTRNILSIFVETAQGERFRFPENHLSGARAFAQHLNQGGTPYDTLSQNIVDIVKESIQLSQVNRYVFHCRNSLSEDATNLRPMIRSRIMEIRKSLVSLSKPRGYAVVKEQGLPLSSMILSEDSSFSEVLESLKLSLQIDNNHALAESLMPVALLKMGESMTTINEMFQGVVVLEDTTADSLLEALESEYGFTTESWSRFGSNVGFSSQEVFEAAQEYLSLVEGVYQINEEDAVANYATAWTSHRFKNSDYDGHFDKAAEEKDLAKAAGELADGIRQILSGNFTIPDYPAHAPTFRDTNAQARFYLDLYVSQNSLANVPTLNYISTIIDKLADGKKLDGAEKTIASKLIDTLEDDLHGGEVDEGYYDDPTSGRDEMSLESAVDDYVDNFEPLEFLNDYYPEFFDETIALEDQVYSEAKLCTSLAKDLNSALERQDVYGANDSYLLRVAKGDLLPIVKTEIEKAGFAIQEGINEFVSHDEEPSGHGISAGSYVSTDLGSGKVLEVDGDIATVEFLSGHTKKMHVDDLDLLGGLSGIAEEAKLAEWFDSFDPMNVLEAPNWSNGIPTMAKAAPVNPNFNPEISVGDRVVHKAYGPGTVVLMDTKNVKVEFDNPHERLPDHRTVTMNKGVVTKAGAYRKEKAVESDSNDEWDLDHVLNSTKTYDSEHEVFKIAFPHGIKSLRPEAVSEGVVGIVTEGMKATNPEALAHIFDKLKSKAEAIMADPESFGLPQPIGQDDVMEENFEFVAALANYLASDLRDDLNELVYAGLEVVREQSVMEGNKATTATYWLEDPETGDEFELEVEYTIDDGSFATGLDYPSTFSYGDIVNIDGILNKTTGADVDFDSLSSKDREAIEQACLQDARERAEDEAEYRADMRRDERYDESIGGDMSDDLVDDITDDHDSDQDIYGMSDEELFFAHKNAWKSRGTMQAFKRMDKIKAELSRRGKSIDEAMYEADETDQVFREELERVLKNARYRGF